MFSEEPKHIYFILFVAKYPLSPLIMLYTKQLLDEAEHDIKNYSDRGQCYLPKRS